MNLSPLTLQNIRDRTREMFDEPECFYDRRADEDFYLCQTCDTEYSTAAMASECCEVERMEAKLDGGYPHECPVCGEEHNSTLQAANCCLWKDLDSATRYRIARAVEAGSSWNEQLL